MSTLDVPKIPIKVNTEGPIHCAKLVAALKNGEKGKKTLPLLQLARMRAARVSAVNLNSALKTAEGSSVWYRLEVQQRGAGLTGKGCQRG